ncbi:GNAT family N-acetyltransferase [Brevibacillus agri]|uniref:GNAT family N-acetyltransferase n=1 Tax=Brevibacillus agri TaxID=51101 RepID=UPI000470CE65|nr:GNAT family N-acetyltransferase [Brevibacillus agri]
MSIHIEPLKQQDAPALFAFECKNREFFERTVPSRGEAYYHYDYFQNSLQAAAGDILGRMNLVDLDHERGSAELGYRVGADAAGKGVASQALKLLLTEYIQPLGIREVQAKTTAENIASQKVLLKNGFVFRETDAAGFWHYCWTR